MAYNPQSVYGQIFRRFNRKIALCKIPFWSNLTKVFNILETIEGDNGITIHKPNLRGFGWRISGATLNAAQPELWDGRVVAGKVEVYMGDGTQPHVVSQDGETGYFEAGLSGWVDHTDIGDLYVAIDADTLAVTIDTTVPDYSARKYGVKIGTATATAWVKKFEGPFIMPLPPGDEDNLILKWNDTSKQWEKGAEQTIPAETAVSIGTPTDGGSATSPVAVVVSLAAAGHVVTPTTQTITIPDTTGMLTSADFTQVTYITDVQYSSGNLQVKTRTGYVLNPGTESAWTTKITFASFND